MRFSQSPRSLSSPSAIRPFGSNSWEFRAVALRPAADPTPRRPNRRHAMLMGNFNLHLPQEDAFIPPDFADLGKPGNEPTLDATVNRFAMGISHRLDRMILRSDSWECIDFPLVVNRPGCVGLGEGLFISDHFGLACTLRRQASDGESHRTG